MHHRQDLKNSPSKLPRTLSTVLPGSGIKKTRKTPSKPTPPTVRNRKQSPVTTGSRSVQNSKSLASCLSEAQKILDDLKASAPADEPQPARVNYQNKLDRLSTFGDEEVAKILAAHLENYHSAVSGAKPGEDAAEQMLQGQFELFNHINALADLCEIKSADIKKTAANTASARQPATTTGTTPGESSQPGNWTSAIGSGAVSQTTSQTTSSQNVDTIGRPYSSRPMLKSREEFAASEFTRLADNLMSARRILEETASLMPTLLENLPVSTVTNLSAQIAGIQSGNSAYTTKNTIALLRSVATELRGEGVGRVSHQHFDNNAITIASLNVPESDPPSYSESVPALTTTTTTSAYPPLSAFHTTLSLPVVPQDFQDSPSIQPQHTGENLAMPGPESQDLHDFPQPEFPNLDFVFEGVTPSGNEFSFFATDIADDNKSLSSPDPYPQATIGRKRGQIVQGSRPGNTKSPKLQKTDLPGGNNNT